MTRDERISFVAAAIEKHSGAISRHHTGDCLDVKRMDCNGDCMRASAEAAIAAADETREVTDAMVEAFRRDAFALVAGKDFERVQFHIRRALAVALQVKNSDAN